MSGTQQTDEEGKVDEGLEETFPASDPPSTGGSTGPGHKPDQPAGKGG